MDKNIWVDPCKSRILGGMFPLTVLLKATVLGESRPIQTLFHDMRDRHYPVIAWSQRRQSADIESIIPELAVTVEIARGMSDIGAVLVGHSRGGLIGRKYLTRSDTPVRGLVTISTPHQGSSVARVARYVAPLAALLRPLIPEHDKNLLIRALKRISDFLRSRALQELLPESEFFRTLDDSPRDGVCYISAGGTNPTLFKLSHVSFPGVFERIIPHNLYPVEMRAGEGDGLVSTESSKIPWADEHHAFPCNHAMILFDEDARSVLLNAIERCVERHG